MEKGLTLDAIHMYNQSMVKRALLCVFVVMVVCGAPVIYAQEPTPTPDVVQTSEGAFTLVPEITYGDAGVMLALIFVAGLLLVRLMLEVTGWLVRRFY
jgi:hypothetical protein